MFVIATAGHVDHGKSTLLHRLTGMWPDRLAEEKRRGLTIDLGFAWTELGGRQLAFVDVPGHERFVANMLAGVGAVPAVLFVVAATEGWMPQSEEHLAALDALGVRHGLAVISKADLADPGPATRQARERFAATSLAGIPVAVGTDLDRVRSELLALTERLPVPDPDADVRLWVDRSFTVRGAGTVVTGTLAAGTIRVGDELEHAGRRVTVRGLQSLGRDLSAVGPVARVALNLRGVERGHIGRGDAVRTPGVWLDAAEIDVALRSAEPLHRQLMLHVGSAAVPVRVRQLGEAAARLRLARPLPLRVSDIGLLRDPGEHRIAAGVEVLDVRPPALRRRGAARDRAAELATGRVRPPDCARVAELRAMGLPLSGLRVGDWLVDPQWWGGRRECATAAVRRWADDHDIAAGMPLETLRQRAGLPSAELLPTLLEGTGLQVADGLVRAPGAGLPARVDKAVRTVEEWLAAEPFRAPEADELAELRLGPRELAAAVRAGRLTRIADGVVLGAGALDRAAGVLAALPQPFTVSDARRALATTRRVAVPLLEQLDARRVTRRSPDGTRVVVSPG
ncbi:selenocysteine-specific translation elongation factor [Mycobacterium paraseoulense]|uniref:Selenocysteine-specific translation elongation factor n=1 Tax=Mycobacterium paraseoulense TaxID=590652 RepID=A0A1X0I8K4_9MYCO|nr:selenocysteine-specific translation elongation factor [Mycobacterium paraseoulense]MCV7395965.1 SelB C-terminal domain-containing protein [Mycobacterium paraseoulense]ORB37465.1 selenocysteine-specific translation elongation factor [Mycobacterium paraseoulense]BBZ72365.1 translation elongation factor [Mycobacterium paraseoulense]